MTVFFLVCPDLWESIETRFPPRTNLTTNASRWNGGCGEACNNADAWWRWYEDSGFNTFVKGWMGTAFAEGYGEMLTYLHDDLNTSIMPILNVGDTQEVLNAKSTEAKVAQAGLMARNFANSSFLLYCASTCIGHRCFMQPSSWSPMHNRCCWFRLGKLQCNISCCIGDCVQTSKTKSAAWNPRPP